jgi:phosphatidylglycerophosphate synthase
MPPRVQLTEDARLSPEERHAPGRMPGRNEAPGAAEGTDAALLFATSEAAEGSPAAVLRVLETTVLGRLLGQLESLGVRRAWVVTRPAWRASVEAVAAEQSLEVTVVASEGGAEDLRLTAEIAGDVDGALVIGNAHVVTHREALAGLLSDPRIGSGVLSTDLSATISDAFQITSRRARVVSAASPYHRVSDPTGYFLGLLKVGGDDLESLVSASRELALLGSAAKDEPVPLLLVGLVRSQVGVFSSNVREFFHAAPLSREAAERAGEELSRSDEDRVLLDAAVKGNDGFFTTFFVSPYSKYIARFAARRGWTPNAVSTASLVLGVAAAASFAVGSRAGLIAGAILLQISFTVDCVDGQLARYTRTFSKLGGWIDSIFDRTKEYLVYAGLAIGSTRGFEEDVWLLAAVALALQTVRHMSDFSYVGSYQAKVAAAPAVPLDQPDDLPPATGPGVRASAARSPWISGRGSGRAGRWTGLLGWGNRIVRLPIGERFALISLTAALSSPRTTFVVLLAWGTVAAAYALSARILMSYRVPQRLARAVAK